VSGALCGIMPLPAQFLPQECRIRGERVGLLYPNAAVFYV
jgi:hypothetical protein